MEWAAWLNHSLPAAAALGAFLEGETLLLAASALAHLKGMDPWPLWAAASLGAWLGHAFWFGVGRLMGRERILALRPSWRPALEKADALVKRRPVLSLVALQYAYGLRLAGAVALGLSSLALPLFLAIQAFNCMAWAALVVAGGTLLAGPLVDRLDRLSLGLQLGVLALALGWLLWKWRRTRGRRPPSSSTRA